MVNNQNRNFSHPSINHSFPTNPNRFWVKGDNGWFSVSVTEDQKKVLRSLRSFGIELEPDSSEVPQEDVLFVVHGEMDDE